MSRKPYLKPHTAPEKASPSPELERILCDLKSPDAQTRANAVRSLCPCRNSPWEVAVFPHVLELRNEQVREEIEAGFGDSRAPAPHSQAWRMHRRPRRRKWHYPKGSR
jgi:hypothetical protein